MSNKKAPKWYPQETDTIEEYALVTGGHFTPEQIKEMFPDKVGDLEILDGLPSPCKYGYIRHEYPSQYSIMYNDGKPVWVWYDIGPHGEKPKGVVQKATEVEIWG